MNGKEELIRRTMKIIKEIFKKKMRALSYYKSNMEWRFNHMSGYGLYCTRIRKALQGCVEEGRQIRHRGYHVQMITEQIHLVNGVFSIASEEDREGSLETPFEIVVCMSDGMAECVHIYGMGRERLLLQVRSFREEIWFLESTDTLKRLEGCLPGAFVRIHRCYIINVGQIHKISGNEVEMTNGDILLIPVRNGAKVQKEILSKAGEMFLSP